MPGRRAITRRRAGLSKPASASRGGRHGGSSRQPRCRWRRYGGGPRRPGVGGACHPRRDRRAGVVGLSDRHRDLALRRRPHPAQRPCLLRDGAGAAFDEPGVRAAGALAQPWAGRPGAAAAGAHRPRSRAHQRPLLRPRSGDGAGLRGRHDPARLAHRSVAPRPRGRPDVTGRCLPRLSVLRRRPARPVGPQRGQFHRIHRYSDPYPGRRFRHSDRRVAAPGLLLHPVRRRLRDLRRRAHDHRHLPGPDRGTGRRAGQDRGPGIGLDGQRLGQRRRQRHEHRHLHHSPDEARQLRGALRRRRRGGGLDRRPAHAADHGGGGVHPGRLPADALPRGGARGDHSGASLFRLGAGRRRFRGAAPQARGHRPP